MTGRAWPIDAVPDETGDPLYAARHGRQTSIAPFLFGAKTGRALGARSGVRAGTPAATVEVTSTTWTTHQFAGAMDVEAASEAGPYGFAFDADESGAVMAAHATYTRWDGLYVQLDDPAEDETTAPAIRVVYANGAAAASPALPAIPPERSFRLCKIVVPPAGGGSPTVVWDPPFLAEGIVPVTSVAELNALSVYATPECPVYATLGGRLQVGNGTTWLPVNAPDWFVRMERTSNASIVTSGSYTPLTVWEVEAAAGLTTALGVVTIPVAGRYRVSWGAVFAPNGTGGRAAVILKNGTTAAQIVATDSHWGNASIATRLHAARTIALAAGDTLRLALFQSSGGALDAQASAADPIFLNVEYLGA